VFSRRIADVVPDELRPWTEPVVDQRAPGLVAGTALRKIQKHMTKRVGVLRVAEGLSHALTKLRGLETRVATDVGPEEWEATNLLTISTALTAAASLREETRGSHWREDFPARDDARWAGHFDVTLVDGEVAVEFHPAPATDGVTHEVSA
jgi:L-aspartate oxidase